MSKIIVTRSINTYRSAVYCAPVFMLAFHLAGCEPESDLDPGQAKIHLTRTRTMPDGEVTVTEHEFWSSSASVYILPEYTSDYEDAWALEVPLRGVPDYYVVVNFKSPGPDPSQLAEGDGQGYLVAVDIPEKEHHGDSPFDGFVHITGLTGETASGDVSVGVDVEIWNYVQQEPTGETIRVESIEFDRIPINPSEPPFWRKEL